MKANQGHNNATSERPNNLSLSTNLTPRIMVKDKQVCYNNKEQTLLECLEINEIEMHYHCRDGFCGACRVTLLSGEINYPQGEPLAFVGENEILPCCCVPVTDICLLVDE